MSASPTSVFGRMTSPLTGPSNYETVTVSNCPSQPTITITMAKQVDGGKMVQVGDAAYGSLTNLGGNKWSFRIWVGYWYNAPGSGTGIIMPKGSYCQGNCAITAGGQTVTVTLSGSIRDGGIV